ncbi:MAG TPA: FecR domain-containing protein, partial [Gemmatimonadaceae bacterium]|nr:FecR domain-containing protein [Gemmatimonadaceae bacterium]
LLASLEHRAQETERVDVEAALASVHTRMGRNAASALKLERPSRAWYAETWVRAAAAVVVIAGATWALAGRQQKPEVQTASAQPSVFRTGVGQRDSVTLPDGSKVTLGPGSSVSVPAEYASARTVTLNGEARFDVAHNAARPFVVRLPEGSVTDIGTVFTVRSYGGAGADVAVQAGSVALRSGTSDSVVLRAGDAGSMTADGKVTRAARAGSDDDTAWLKGQLVFREAPMVRVRTDLKRWFGVEIVTLDSTLAARHLTVSFSAESRAQMLDIIAGMLGATYDTHGDTVVLRSKRPQ